MSDLRLYGFDPGKNSGIAVWSAADDVFESLELEHFDAIDYLSDRLYKETVPVALYCENFIITARTAELTAQPWSLKAIGAVEWLCRGWRIPFYLNTAAKAKKFSTDAKLRKLGWYRPTKDGHANDAARQLLLGAVDLDQLDLRRLIDG
jgi:hypothetical protein